MYRGEREAESKEDHLAGQGRAMEEMFQNCSTELDGPTPHCMGGKTETLRGQEFLPAHKAYLSTLKTGSPFLERDTTLNHSSGQRPG